MSAKRYLSSSSLPLVAALPPIRGRWFFVDGTDGSDANDGLSPEAPLKTLYATTTTTGDTGAYAKCTTSAGDGICILSSATASASKSITVSAAFTWSKCGITVYGVASGARMSSRARITNVSTLLTAPALITVSGHNNRFENVQFFNSGTDATALGCVIVTGLRNHFKNCHFVGGSCTTATANERSLELGAGAQENFFDGCTIGTDTIDRGNNANCELYLNGDNDTCRNEFYNCSFIGMASTGTAHVAIKSAGTTAYSHYMAIKDSLFYCYIPNKGTAMASVYGGTAAGSGEILVHNCGADNYAAWDSGGTTNLFVTNAAGAATGGIGAGG